MGRFEFFRSWFAYCESPTEMRMLWELAYRPHFSFERKRDRVAQDANGGLLMQQAGIGAFRVDFLLASSRRRLVVECDSVQCHSSHEAIAADQERDGWFRSQGYLVQRYAADRLLHDARVPAVEAYELVRPPPRAAVEANARVATVNALPWSEQVVLAGEASERVRRGHGSR
jgi:very-short-patch-repair endonuclease